MSSEPQFGSEMDTAAEVQIPSTPVPSRATLPEPKDDVLTAPKASVSSPPLRTSSADLTPPPSSQIVLPNSPPAGRRSISQLHQYPASPPATVRINSSFNVPSTEEISTASETVLRHMVNELVAAVREARMSAAHFKLQHSLLSMESHESAQRAEIEHQMTRREVEVLQAENRSRQSSTQTPRGPQMSPQSATESLKSRCQSLEIDLAKAEHRVGKAKRLIEDKLDRIDHLEEENILLKRRIRENRDHYIKLKMQSPAFTSPRHEFVTPQRKQMTRYLETGDSQPTEQMGSQDPFAALLAADQVLNGEPISVPSTPSRLQTSKIKRGHIRGAYSLSSIQSTPTRTHHANPTGPAAPASARIPFSAPSTQQRNDSARHDRDSTISVSDEDVEERERRYGPLSDDELPQSQASSLATSMLRRNPGHSQSQETPPPSGTAASAEKQSNLLQAKLFGQVQKAGINRSGQVVGKEGKRRASFEADDIAEKKKRMKSSGEENKEGVGLGIGSWGSPRR